MLYIRGTNNRYRMADEQDVIFEAIQIYNRYFSRGEALTSPDKAKDCIKLKLAPFEHCSKIVLAQGINDGDIIDIVVDLLRCEFCKLLI